MYLILLLASMFISLTCQAEWVDGFIDKGLTGKARILVEGRDFGSGSLSCWFLPKQDSAKPAMLLSGGNNSPQFFTLRLADNQLTFTIKDAKGQGNVKLVDQDLTIPKWHHLLCVWGKHKDTSFANIYLNGLLRAHSEGTYIPDRFHLKELYIASNSANHAEPPFNGIIDEIAFYDVALNANHVQELAKGKAVRLPGTLFNLNGNLNPLPIDADKHAPEPNILARRAFREKKLQAYHNELDFIYEYDRFTKEAKPNCLNDGIIQTGAHWKDAPREITCSLSHTALVDFVEIVAQKHTKWYMLKELVVMVDPGNGSFTPIKIIPAYYKPLKPDTKLIDETCKPYTYRIDGVGQACRIRIKASGDAHMMINEIRICGKYPQSENELNREPK